MKPKSGNRISDITFIGMFTALLTVCSWITIPLTVPFTMQTFGIFITVALLGIKRSMLTFTVYMLLGLIGIPVFSNFGAGPGVLLGPTGGYLIGFFFTILMTGFLIKIFGKKPLPLFFSMTAGLLFCYIFGTLWFMIVYGQGVENMSFLSVISTCVLPFIIPDLCKIGLAVAVHKRTAKYFFN